jgi:hypothetical protein
MTNLQLEAIYNSGISQSHIAALKTVYNAGYYAHAGVTPNDSTPDVVSTQTAPTAYVKPKKPD